MAKMVAQHNKHLLQPLEPGTSVLREIPSQQVGKMDMPKDGPWTVTEHRSLEGRPLPVYIVKDDRGNRLFSHREQLSEFKEPLLPDKPPEEE